MKGLLIIFFLGTIASAYADCPELTAELAKKVDIDCVHHDKITEPMKEDWLTQTHATLNVCWTTFSAQKLSRLLEIRKLDLAGIEEQDVCHYSRDDETSYISISFAKNQLK